MIVPPETLLLFLPVAAALALTPGADMLFSLGQGLRWGPGAGLAAAAGASSGVLVHATAAGLGLALLVAQAPMAFEVIRWAGVAYLVWLAVQTLRADGPLRPDTATVASGPAASFWRAMLVNLLNPKVSIFILALLPQFVVRDAGSQLAQFLVLGGLLALVGFAVNATVGLSAGRIGKALMTRRRLAAGIRVVTGSLLFGLAARLAFEKR